MQRHGPLWTSNERLRVGQITQDVKRLTAVRSNHACPTFGLQFEKCFLVTWGGMKSRHRNKLMVVPGFL